MSLLRPRVRRRAVLRGLGGACIALPFLEALMPKKAAAAPPPNRYVVAFGGSSTGIDGQDSVVPASEGPLDPAMLTRGLSPLGDLGVTDVTSVVTGMEIQFGPDGSIPAGGRAIQWHSSSLCPLVCGMRSADGGDESIMGETSDWKAASLLAEDTKHPVLAYRIQAANYRGSNGTGGTRGMMSARLNGGTLEDVTPIISPKVAFESLFTGFVPPDPAEAEAAKFLLMRRKSIIDLVRGDTEQLVGRLGAADKIRMQRHLDELRALEKRLEGIAPPGQPACEMLPDPGNDPPIGAAVENGEQGMGGGYDSTNAYSDEEARATIMVDLIHMAFACDLSRVASLMFTYAQCFLNMNPIFGHPSDLHEMSHYSMGGGQAGADAVADGVAWHLKHFARLTQKLRDTEDVDGSSLLDHTGLVILFEGGWGYDPEQDAQGSAHSSENMIVVAAGNAGGMHQTGGKHIRARGAHPVQVVNTVMNAVGVPGDLGEVPGTIPQLIG